MMGKWDVAYDGKVGCSLWELWDVAYDGNCGM